MKPSASMSAKPIYPFVDEVAPLGGNWPFRANRVRRMQYASQPPEQVLSARRIAMTPPEPYDDVPLPSSEYVEDAIDEAEEESFPASDPPASSRFD
jgi:hypothetical protein